MNTLSVLKFFPIIFFLFCGCAKDDPISQELKLKQTKAVENTFTEKELRHILRLSPLPEPPDDPTNAVFRSAAAARFGQYLFFDRKLSGPGTISCATCHQPEKSWTDGKSLANGLQPLDRHSMTLWNVAYNRWYFWDGRADTLWSQALVPLEDEREHGGNRLQYAHYIYHQKELRRAYEDIFGPMPDLSDIDLFPKEGRPVPLQPDHPHNVSWMGMNPKDRKSINRIFSNLGKSIAAYQRNIITNSSPFDYFVEGLRNEDTGKLDALTPSAIRGLKLFVGRARCHLCHSGPNFTDGEFHRTGVPSLDVNLQRDPGRQLGLKKVIENEFNGVGAYSDDPDGEAKLKIDYLPRHFHAVAEFKTPSLRNVAFSAPYMHHGQISSLKAVVIFYSSLEAADRPESALSPLNLSEIEIEDLVAFMESLNSNHLDPALMRRPKSPLL